MTTNRTWKTSYSGGLQLESENKHCQEHPVLLIKSALELIYSNCYC